MFSGRVGEWLGKDGSALSQVSASLSWNMEAGPFGKHDETVSWYFLYPSFFPPLKSYFSLASAGFEFSQRSSISLLLIAKCCPCLFNFGTIFVISRKIYSCPIAISNGKHWRILPLGIQTRSRYDKPWVGKNFQIKSKTLVKHKYWYPIACL